MLVRSRVSSHGVDIDMRAVDTAPAPSIAHLSNPDTSKKLRTHDIIVQLCMTPRVAFRPCLAI